MNKPEKFLLAGTALYGVQTSLALGAIVHVNGSPVSVPTTATDPVDWDIDQDATADISITRGTFFDQIQFNLNGENLNGFVKATGDGAEKVRNLAANFSVKATMTGYDFNATNQNSIDFHKSTGFLDAIGFTDNVAGNVGFRFNKSGSTHYGWAQFTIDVGNPATLTISEWAYNDVADGAIKVGVVPEPASTGVALGLLAAGAAGMRRWKHLKRMAS